MEIRGNKQGVVISLCRWLPPIALYGVMFWFSGRSQDSLPVRIPDVIPHFLEFLALGFLLARAARPRRRSALMLLFLVAMVLALGDEFHQSFVPTRVCSLKDFLVDSLGALTGLYLWGKLKR